MKNTELPAFRLTSDCIWNSFRSSGKKHLILTGARKSGKTTLLSELLSRIGSPSLPCPIPGITTWAEPGKAVYLKENTTGQTACIGLYDESLPGTKIQQPPLHSPNPLEIGFTNGDADPDNTAPPPAAGNKMRPCAEGFLTLGIPALGRCAESDSEFVSLDEIGYLESQCNLESQYNSESQYNNSDKPFTKNPRTCLKQEESQCTEIYREEIRKLMACKRLLAVVRKQSLPFLEELSHRDDVFLLDLDQPFGRLGCVIMASGVGRRFGGNKLMADFQGKPLLQYALEATEGIFARRIVVTRHQEAAAFVRLRGVEALLHDLPHRNDTVRLGLQAVSEDVEGCLFCPGDQPLLRQETVASLALHAVNGKDEIWRPVWEDREGAPVLFPKWSFPKLLTLPEGCGGSFLIKKYPGRIRRVPVRDKFELQDIDSRQDLEFLEKG